MIIIKKQALQFKSVQSNSGLQKTLISVLVTCGFTRLTIFLQPILTHVQLRDGQRGRRRLRAGVHDRSQKRVERRVHFAGNSGVFRRTGGRSGSAVLGDNSPAGWTIAPGAGSSPRLGAEASPGGEDAVHRHLGILRVLAAIARHDGVDRVQPSAEHRRPRRRGLLLPALLFEDHVLLELCAQPHFVHAHVDQVQEGLLALVQPVVK